MRAYGWEIPYTQTLDKLFQAGFDGDQAHHQAEKILREFQQNVLFSAALQEILKTRQDLKHLSNMLTTLPVQFDNPHPVSPALAKVTRDCRHLSKSEIATFQFVTKSIHQQLSERGLLGLIQWEYSNFNQTQGKGLSVYVCKLGDSNRVGLTQATGQQQYQLALNQADSGQGLSHLEVAKRLAQMFGQGPDEVLQSDEIPPDVQQSLCEPGPQGYPASTLMAAPVCQKKGYVDRSDQTTGAPVLNTDSPLLGEAELGLIRKAHSQYAGQSPEKAFEDSVKELVERMRKDFGDRVAGHFASSLIQQLFCTMFSELVVSCAANERNRMFLKALGSLIGNLLSAVALSQSWRSVPLSLGSFLGHRLTHTGYALGQLLGAVGLFNLVLGAIRGNSYPIFACVSAVLGAAAGQVLAELLISIVKGGSLQRSPHHQQAMRLLPPENHRLLLDYIIDCLGQPHDQAYLQQKLTSAIILLRNADRGLARYLNRYIGLNGARECLSQGAAAVHPTLTNHTLEMTSSPVSARLDQAQLQALEADLNERENRNDSVVTNGFSEIIDRLFDEMAPLNTEAPS